jgi:hypothetical protein
VLCAFSLSSAAIASAAACGDGLLEEGETCAVCVADCTPASCTPGSALQRVRVDLSAPPESKLTAVTARLTYRSDVLRLPRDQGDAAVRKRLASGEAPTVLSADDEGYALRVVVVRNAGLDSGPLVEVEFDRCAGARLPTAADLSCVVEGCTGLAGPVHGCRCRATTL